MDERPLVSVPMNDGRVCVWKVTGPRPQGDDFLIALLDFTDEEVCELYADANELRDIGKALIALADKMQTK